jgi:predicted transcriptional regulator
VTEFSQSPNQTFSGVNPGTDCANGSSSSCGYSAPYTIRDIARVAGVSTTTVSRVLAGSQKVAERTRSRVKTAISDMNYCRNENAAALVRTRSRFPKSGQSLNRLKTSLPQRFRTRARILESEATRIDELEEENLRLKQVVLKLQEILMLASQFTSSATTTLEDCST